MLAAAVSVPTRAVPDTRLGVNATGSPVTLLLDWTPGTPVLQGNLLQPGDEAVSSRGLLRNRVITFLRSTKDAAMDGARWVKAHAKSVMGR